MHAMMLFSLLGVAGSLSAGSVLGTWRQYGAAWNAIDVEMRGGYGASRHGGRLVPIPVVSDERMGGLVYLPQGVFASDMSARSQRVRQGSGLRVAA